jgi:hypothetical protein
LVAIRRQHVKALIVELRKTLAARSAADVVMVLSMVLQEAVEDRRIPFNPCRGVRVATSGRPERPHATTQQVAAIAARVRRRIDGLMVVTAAYTGMRWGELAGLDRDNVDLDKATIYVHPEVGALHEVGGKLFLGPPKTADSVRYIGGPEQPRAPHLLPTCCATPAVRPNEWGSSPVVPAGALCRLPLGVRGGSSCPDRRLGHLDAGGDNRSQSP